MYIPDNGQKTTTRVRFLKQKTLKHNMKPFDYYIFIDYSESFLGYLIAENKTIKKFLPKISKFAHYREIKHKSAYIQAIKKVIEKNKVLSYLLKVKIRR